MGWDRKIPFESLQQKLLDQFNLFLSLWYIKKSKKRISKQIVYQSIALLQLFNGLRAGEAVRAFKKWMITNADEVEVEVEKRKDGATRPAMIPAILRFNRNIIEKSIDLGFDGDYSKITTQRYKSWFLMTYNINTHTLRKAFESFLARKLNKDLALITTFQGRKSVESHLAYLRKEEAKEEIKKVLKGIF